MDQVCCLSSTSAWVKNPNTVKTQTEYSAPNSKTTEIIERQLETRKKQLLKLNPAWPHSIIHKWYSPLYVLVHFSPEHHRSHTS
jgi:hypothetical protein